MVQKGKAAVKKWGFFLLFTSGHRALDDILPELLRQLDDEKLGPYALDGLKQVMMVKSRAVLPFLIPKVQYVQEMYIN